MEQLKERPKHALKLTKTGVSKLINTINSNWSTFVCWLISFNTDRAKVKFYLGKQSFGILTIFSSGEISFEIKPNNNPEYTDYIFNFSGLRYAELENLFLLVVLPCVKAGKPMNLKIVSVDNGWSYASKTLMRPNGLKANMYNKTLLVAIKTGFVNLVNAKITSDFKILPLEPNKNFNHTRSCRVISYKWEK